MGGLPTSRREQYWTDLSFADGASSERQETEAPVSLPLSKFLAEWDPKMSDPSPLVFELCTAIDRFYEREPDLSVSDVLAALDEVSMALACKRARTHWSRANVVRMSDYRHSI
jgi:hypothetical protein